MKTISLQVSPQTTPRFTTLLQSGFYLNARQGIMLGELLSTLPGFTKEYIQSRIETIFLDGLPADELNQQLHGEEIVIALSAAMPGLAGAIFRKGGVHASLRTETAVQSSYSADPTVPLRVRIKLFNVIAVERGGDLLTHGCEIMALSLAKYLSFRPTLLADIIAMNWDNSLCDWQELLPILGQDDHINLIINELP